jgi:hypothetical protein
MKSAVLDKIVNAVLYEGYILYPYRPSSKKNRRERFTFGRVYPKAYSDAQRGAEPCLNQTECLLQSNGKPPALEVTVRFLHPMWREVGYLNPTKGTDPAFRAVPELLVDGVLYQSWQEATEREVTVSLRILESSPSKLASSPFSFRASCALEPLTVESGTEQAAIMRRQESLQGVVEVEATPLSAHIFKLTVRVLNRTPLAASHCDDQDAVIMRTFASTHTILHATDAAFVSQMDPPAEFKQSSVQCKNIGTWPVLVGDENQAQRDTLLSSPIILYDYPRIAPESAGSFFDGTEIDEMLTLRVLTMTDTEKLEMRQVDQFARRILERTETTGAQDLLKMHGTMREVKAAEDFFNPSKRVESVFAGGQELRAGDGVRIRPKKRADAIDMMLDGKAALIEAIEQDAEGTIHLALVLEDDPGKDLGLARQPGHRFFYGLDEVEPLQEASR